MVKLTAPSHGVRLPFKSSSADCVHDHIYQRNDAKNRPAIHVPPQSSAGRLLPGRSLFRRTPAGGFSTAGVPSGSPAAPSAGKRLRHVPEDLVPDKLLPAVRMTASVKIKHSRSPLRNDE